MAVWDSARVIGRAANTRVCATVSFSAQGYGIEWDNEDTETESITPVSGCNGYASSFNAATWTLNARADSPTIAYAGPATEHVCSQVGGEDPYETARVLRVITISEGNSSLFDQDC